MATSYSISAGFTEMWAAEIHEVFQIETSLLRDACRTVTGIHTHTYAFPVLGAATATVNKNPNTTLVPAAEAYSVATATMSSLTCYKLLDAVEELQTNADVRQAYTKSVVAAINRGLDDLVIAAVDGGATDVTSKLPTANTLNEAGLAAMAEQLSINSVPMDKDRWAIVSVGGNKDILTDSTLVSNLYVDKGAVEDGVARNVLGFNVRMSNRTLVPSATNHANYFFHREAIGLALAEDLTVRVEYRPDLDSWGFLAKMIAGSVAIDTTGMFKSTIAD